MEEDIRKNNLCKSRPIQGKSTRLTCAEILNYKKAALQRNYNREFQELFEQLDTCQCESISHAEVIFTLIQFKDLIPDLQIDKFVTENGIKPREEDRDINLEEFKELLESIVV